MFEEKENFAEIENALLTNEKLSQSQRNNVLTLCGGVDRGITSISSAMNVLLNIHYSV